MNRQDAKIGKEGGEEPGAELDDLAYRVIGAAIEVHRELGPGFLESVYEEALVVELGLRGITSRRQVDLPLTYKGHPLDKRHRIDMLVEDQLVLELKACDGIDPVHLATALSYLKATGLHLALIINFNSVILKDGIRRVIRS